MEQQEMQEERRARNFVWAAAEQYGLEPLFLAYAPDGTADMYLNIIIGLSYKWYDAQKLETFFHMLGGRQEELYQGMLWIGLEQALYEKEQAHRPALTDLRQEYAQENLGRYRSFKEYELIDQLRNGHCAAILGQDSGLSGRMEELLQELTFTGDMEIEQIIARMKVILWKYFSYEPKPVKKERGTYFLQKLLPAFHSIGKMHATYVKTKRYDDPVWEESGNGGTMERARHYLLQFSREGDGEKDRAYIEGCFGFSICSPGEEKLMEEELCTENHKNSHIYITEGYSKAVSPAGERWNEKAAEAEKKIDRREAKEIQEFRENCKRQTEKNRQYYEKNRTIYENSIRRMTEKLRLELDTRLDDVPLRARQGKICASQEQIAAQSYILVKSLDLCRIPLQVYSYCSIRGYTVLRLFQSYGEIDRAEEVFSYVAAGNNRDGLALRGAGHLMENSEQEKKLLLVLTDGSPQDDRIAAEGAFYKNREYTDQIAVEDTTEQVQHLKRKGIQVVGIFMGTERGLQTAHRIFGRDFVRIENIQQFSEVVGKILQEKIREII